VLQTLEVKYTKFSTEEHLVAGVVRGDLTPALVRLNPILSQEVGEVIALEIPNCLDWTPVNVNQKLLRIVAMVSGRVFIGSELCRDERYVEAAINYTVDVMGFVRAVQGLPHWQRRFRAAWLPERRNVLKWQAQAMEFLQPVIARRLADARRLGDKYEKPDDVLQWVMDKSETRGQGQDLQKIAKAQLALSFAAIHTTTHTASHGFYNIATMPEVQDELRQEVVQVLAQSGGEYTSLALQKMKKLDSFLRETMRFDPPGMVSFNRKVLKPITLSSGQVIPAGVNIEIPAIGLNFDASIHQDPDKFDPFRFSRLRQAGEAAKGTQAAEAGAMNQLVSVNKHHLPFGFGRHACPGRFFAANEIKMIFANMLTRYKIANPEGIEGRVPNMVFGGMVSVTCPFGWREGTESLTCVPR
jgi:cytochrome P450